MLFPTLGQAVYPLWWSSLAKDMQTEQFLCWSGMTDKEYSTTSNSNEEEDQTSQYYCHFIHIGS